MNDPLAALPYYGGASATSRSGIARWAAQILPQTDTYCEPFAGMLGVLLQRPPAQTEIANDLNGDITNWWTIVRDRPDELTAKLRLTPTSHHEFYTAKHADWSKLDELERARATTILLACGYGNFARRSYAQYKGKYSPFVGQGLTQITDRIHRLADRLRNVTLLAQNAPTLLRQLNSRPTAVVYCDPPYQTDDRHLHHSDHHLDVNDFTEAAQQSKCHVIIQGRPGEWEHLNWPSYTLPPTHQARKQANPDILWANRPLQTGDLFND